jgi:hypothetical protein
MVESACFVAPTLLGDSIQGISKDMDCFSFREPLGVCAGECENARVVDLRLHSFSSILDTFVQSLGLCRSRPTI